MPLYLNLQRFQRDVLLQEIKSIKTFYYVKLKAIEYILTFWDGNKPPVRPYLYIDSEKLNRLYIVNDDGCKIISFGFNYLIKTYNKDLSSPNNSVLHLNYCGQKGEISLLNVSEAQSILSELTFEENNYYWGLDTGVSVDNESIRFFEHIVFSEPSYLRYDNTIVGYKPLIHPRYHFDICFSSSVCYKFGLPKHIEHHEMVDILDKSKYCPIMMLSPTNLHPLKKNIRSKKNRRKR